MSWFAARRGALGAAALGLSLAIVLGACSAAAEYLTDGQVTPSPATAASPTFPATASPATPDATAVAATVAPSASASTGTPYPTAIIADETIPPPDLGLVYARGTHILQSGYLGGEAAEIAAVPPYDTWAFDGGRLALALGPAVEVIDLVRGTQTSLRVDSAGEIEFAEVFWGRSSDALLHVAVVADTSASNDGRRVELRALAADGELLGLATLPDLAGITVLRYDGAAGIVAFIPRGAESREELHILDLAAGGVAATHPIVGDGEAAMSPDASRVAVPATEGGAALLIHHLDGDATTRRWDCPAGMRAASPTWSPDGRMVAFLLLPADGEAASAADDIGVWVLENAGSGAEPLEAQPVMVGAGGASTLAGWTPDGSHVLGHRLGEGAGDAYVFAVRPDGGDRRILNLGADAQVLGWMPPVEAGAEALAADPWPARFAQAQQDADAMAAVAAEFVAAHADRPDDALAAALSDYLTEAGWPLDLGGPAVRRIAEGQYAVQLPPQSIYLFEAGRAQRVASGNVLIDVRREGDALGLIYGVIGAGDLQPGFILLGRAPDDAWTPRWTPQGQRDWIATDGEIRFSGAGLAELQVSGTSFGIDLGEAEPFIACHSCLHRRLSGTWVRDGEGYARRDAPSADTPLAHVLWAMTERSDYAIVYEALRRARAGEEVGDLATSAALANLDALGLLAAEVRLMPEEARDGAVFLSGEDGARYRATVEGNRLTEVAVEGS